MIGRKIHLHSCNRCKQLYHCRFPYGCEEYPKECETCNAWLCILEEAKYCEWLIKHIGELK